MGLVFGLKFIALCKEEISESGVQKRENKKERCSGSAKKKHAATIFRMKKRKEMQRP